MLRKLHAGPNMNLTELVFILPPQKTKHTFTNSLVDYDK